MYFPLLHKSHTWFPVVLFALPPGQAVQLAVFPGSGLFQRYFPAGHSPSEQLPLKYWLQMHWPVPIKVGFVEFVAVEALLAEVSSTQVPRPVQMPASVPIAGQGWQVPTDAPLLCV